LLPYLGETAIYNAINFSFAHDDASGGSNLVAPSTLGICFQVQSTACGASLKEFQCPSDPLAGVGQFGAYTRNTNNYNASYGTSTCLTNASPFTQTSYANVPTTGIFGMQNCKSIAAILDGTSNTVAFAEGVISPNNLVPGQKYLGLEGCKGIPVGSILYDASSNPAMTAAGIAACNACWQTGVGVDLDDERGAKWGQGGVCATLFNTVVVPNSTTSPWSYADLYNSSSMDVYANAQSYHPAGVNTLMADGSVKCIKNTIAQYIWWALGTVANGEVVSADQY
jgi:prepilin-type processing-associated H-X9-DG protein